MGVGWTVAESVTSPATGIQQQHLDRATADALTRHLFEWNNQIFGFGHYREANAYDGKDREFVNQPNHDATGRYLVYWNRILGEVASEPLVGYTVRKR